MSHEFGFAPGPRDGDGITERELDNVRRALAEGAERQDRYTLLHILWKARDIRSRDLVWACTEDPDEMVRRIALQALTELSPSDEVFELALRMAEDASKYVRMVAATSVGTLGASLSHRAGAAARFLLDNFDQRQSVADPEWEFYYEGLLNLTRVPPQMRPSVSRTLRVTDIETDVIMTARSMASQS